MFRKLKKNCLKSFKCRKYHGVLLTFWKFWIGWSKICRDFRIIKSSEEVAIWRLWKINCETDRERESQNCGGKVKEFRNFFNAQIVTITKDFTLGLGKPTVKIYVYNRAVFDSRYDAMETFTFFPLFVSKANEYFF